MTVAQNSFSVVQKSRDIYEVHKYYRVNQRFFSESLLHLTLQITGWEMIRLLIFLLAAGFGDTRNPSNASLPIWLWPKGLVLGSENTPSCCETCHLCKCTHAQLSTPRTSMFSQLSTFLNVNQFHCLDTTFTLIAASSPPLLLPHMTNELNAVLARYGKFPPCSPHSVSFMVPWGCYRGSSPSP